MRQTDPRPREQADADPPLDRQVAAGSLVLDPSQLGLHHPAFDDAGPARDRNEGDSDKRKKSRGDGAQA